jgi:hypothetical protein
VIVSINFRGLKQAIMSRMLLNRVKRVLERAIIPHSLLLVICIYFVPVLPSEPPYVPSYHSSVESMVLSFR